VSLSAADPPAADPSPPTSAWARTRPAGCCAPPVGSARPGAGRCSRCAVRDRAAAGRGRRARRRRHAHRRAHRRGARARRQAGATAYRPAADRRPQPASALAHRACPAPGRPAGRARPVAGPPGPPVRLSARQLQRIVAELGADARLVDVTAHTLRDTAATRWLRAGADVVVVAGPLGHASLDATRTYTLPTDRELAAAVEAAAVEARAVELADGAGALVAQARRRAARRRRLDAGGAPGCGCPHPRDQRRTSATCRHPSGLYRRPSSRHRGAVWPARFPWCSSPCRKARPHSRLAPSARWSAVGRQRRCPVRR
jgi:hypothetical protein